MHRCDCFINVGVIVPDIENAAKIASQACHWPVTVSTLGKHCQTTETNSDSQSLVALTCSSLPAPSDRRYTTYEQCCCPVDKSKDYQSCSVLFWIATIPKVCFHWSHMWYG